MRILNLIVAILYTIIFGFLDIAGIISITTQHSAGNYAAPLFFSAAVILNWITFAKWKNATSIIKNINLIAGIIYTAALAILLVIDIKIGLGKNLFFILFFGIPVLVNWLSYFYWPKPVINQVA